MTDLKNATHIIFDWDNTLDNSFAALFDSWNYTLKKYDRPLWDEATAKRNIRRTAHEVMADMFGDVWEQALFDYREYYYKYHVKPNLLDHVEDLLSVLKNDGKTLAVISNKVDDRLKEIVDQSNLNPYFEIVMGADPARLGKPHPLTMDIMIDALKGDINRDHVWYVGDTDIDVQFAKNAHTKSIFVENHGFETLESITKDAPDLAFKNIKAFLDYYKSL